MKSRNRVLYYGKNGRRHFWQVSAAVCARILYFKACAGRSAGIILRRPRGKNDSPKKEAWAEEKLGLNDSLRTVYSLGRQCAAWGFRNFVQI